MARVVVGWVPKPEGDAALERAVAEARLRDLELLLVDVRRRGEEADADLDAVTERLVAAGVPFAVRSGEDGSDGAEDLVEVVEPGDLIVIGLRRRSPLGKLILGSSAQRILLDAVCPVLTVKP